MARTAGTARDAAGNKLTVSFVPATGLFQGKAQLPGTNRWLPFSGALLPAWQMGSGFFLNGNQTGPIQFQTDWVPNPAPSGLDSFMGFTGLATTIVTTGVGLPPTVTIITPDSVPP